EQPPLLNGRRLSPPLGPPLDSPPRDPPALISLCLPSASRAAHSLLHGNADSQPAGPSAPGETCRGSHQHAGLVSRLLPLSAGGAEMETRAAAASGSSGRVPPGALPRCAARCCLCKV